MKYGTSLTLTLLTLAGCLSESEPLSSVGQSSQVVGAIFTTLVDGTQVNANIYDAKEDVYLDGGPGNNAPAGAAALDEGDYYFQVTNPSGSVLLSTDDLECRQFHVNSAGVIDAYLGGAGCTHNTGSDADNGGITIQLIPYDDTPNNGGEYKAWVAPVEGFDGFDGEDTKTDNFKVRESEKEPCSCTCDCYCSCESPERKTMKAAGGLRHLLVRQ